MERRGEKILAEICVSVYEKNATMSNRRSANGKLQIAIFLILVTASGGCLPEPPTKDTGDEEAWDCDGTNLDTEVIFNQMLEDGCNYKGQLKEAVSGDSTNLAIWAPEGDVVIPTGDEFELESNSTPLCVEPAQKKTAWEGDNASNPWHVTYDASCDENCDATEDKLSLTAPVKLCDPNGSYAGVGNAGTPPPPASGTCTYLRTGVPYSGRFWYAILSRVNDKVCIGVWGSLPGRPGGP